MALLFASSVAIDASAAPSVAVAAVVGGANGFLAKGFFFEENGAPVFAASEDSAPPPSLRL
jgi:hypothetical protein